MKFSIVAASLLSTVAVASPVAGGSGSGRGRGGGGHGWGGWGGWHGHQPYFTSTYSVTATPRQVVNATANGDFVYTGGLPGCKGYFDYSINSKTETICWDIKLYNFRGQYQSLADTSTHIHEGARGKTGPPRIVFPNPQPTGKGYRQSSGCMKGPFRTGIDDATTGKDTGVGFKLKEIEADPEAFFTDVHSSLAVPGAVRGQLD